MRRRSVSWKCIGWWNPDEKMWTIDRTYFSGLIFSGLSDIASISNSIFHSHNLYKLFSVRDKLDLTINIKVHQEQKQPLGCFESRVLYIYHNQHKVIRLFRWARQPISPCWCSVTPRVPSSVAIYCPRTKPSVSDNRYNQPSLSCLLISQVVIACL